MKNTTFVTTEGGLLNTGFLSRLKALDKNLGGLEQDAYHLSGEKIHEAISNSWNRLQGAWQAFRAASERLPESETAGTALTREKWLQPLYRELEYGRLAAEKQAFEIDEKPYRISHFWGNSPIHMVRFRQSLDKRDGKNPSPHSMVQEFLNCSDDHLWAFVSNGHILRILRDNASLTRQAYIEFDLEGIFENEAYADFSLLWLLCHQSRIEGDIPHQCWLERWVIRSQESGTRALDHLRDSVEKAIEKLGEGFLADPANRVLQDQLRNGELDNQEYYRELLRLVYRLIFLMVAEDRTALLKPSASPDVKKIYNAYYSVTRLRKIAAETRGTRHTDLWQSLHLVMEKLWKSGCDELGLPALGSFLWSPEAIPHLEEAKIPNSYLLSAIRHLAFTVEGKVRQAVDFRNMGSEELGSVYESLLEMHPEIHIEARSFRLEVAQGHERKTTGSYYTPTPLIQSLLDSCLNPVIEQAMNSEDPQTALLDLKVCDPACGSGHFLTGAAHRLARKLAEIRTGDAEPPPEETRKALREVINRCLYGVDINPMSVELCKVSLWMEAMEPGKPLGFLDHHIRCGNSLIGTTPRLIAGGIPDSAFKAIEGDDKKFTTALKKRNKAERDGGFISASLSAQQSRDTSISSKATTLHGLSENTLADVAAVESSFQDILNSSEWRSAKLTADAWCYAFVQQKVDTSSVILANDNFYQLKSDPDLAESQLVATIQKEALRYGFFHWHLEFPEVFKPSADPGKMEYPDNGWEGGFDCVLGNPPWERVKIQQKEWFAKRVPAIAEARTASIREKMIADLLNDQTSMHLHAQYINDLQKAEGMSHFIRNSGRYPLAGRGDVNTYPVFAEGNRLLVSATGRMGIIVPTGIATDDTTKFFFQDLVASGSIVSLFDFENSAPIFQGVHRSFKFCLLSLRGPGEHDAVPASFVFLAHEIEALTDPEKVFTLLPADFELLNPNTRTCPIFRSGKDAELTKAIYRRVPVLIKEKVKDDDGKVIRAEQNPWGVKFSTMFHMSNDSHLFRTQEEMENEGFVLEGNHFVKGDERYLPLYEAKMTDFYNHRAADVVKSATAVARQRQPRALTLEELQDPNRLAIPASWVAEEEVDRATGDWDRKWFIGMRDVTSSTNERTAVFSPIPYSGVGNNLPVLFPGASSEKLPTLIGCCSSFAFDWIARLCVGGLHMNFFIVKQLATLHPNVTENDIRDWITQRVLELTYTAQDLAPFAKDLGYTGSPFPWNEDRRFQLRCELDVLFFHLYLGSEENWANEPESLRKHFPNRRSALEYMMEAFPIVKRKDVAAHGSYRTKERILGVWNQMEKVGWDVGRYEKLTLESTKFGTIGDQG